MSNKVCVASEIRFNLSVFNIATGINESKSLTKHISCKCRRKLYGRRCNSNQNWNDDRLRCECKKYHIYEKDYTEILLHAFAKTVTN